MELEIEIQYLAEMIDPGYTYFKITLINCGYYAFESWKKGTIHDLDADQIRSLIIDMDISNAKNGSNYVNVFCNGDENTIGGTFSFSCEEISIIDQGGKTVNFDGLLKAARQYWGNKRR